MIRRLRPELFIALTVLIHVTPLSVRAATFSAQRLRSDTVDAVPGDGICADAIGQCSLRAAIDEANALPGRDQVLLSTAAGDDGVALLLDEVVITDDIDIVGLDTRQSRIIGTRLRRLLRIEAGVDARIAGVALSLGLADDGGILKNDGSLLLEGVKIVSGFAKRGGGVFNSGTLIARDSFFLANVGQAPDSSGGTIYNSGLLRLDRVTLAKGQAVVGCGGGVFNDAGGVVEITNSTLARNGARKGSGGAICNRGGTVRCTNCTIARNRSTSGGGGVLNSGGTVQLLNTVLAGNTAATAASNCAGDPILSLGHNLDDGTTCALTAPGDRSAVDPLLRSLETSYSGYSPVVPLVSSASPLVDAGDDSACPSVDQRGWLRPYGSACDIGATEEQPALPTPTRSPTHTAAPSVTASPVLSASPSPVHTPTPTLSPTPTVTATKTPTETPQPTATPTPYPEEDFVVAAKAVDGPDALPGDGICATADGVCTLRAAVQEADATAVARTIHLPLGLTRIRGDLVVTNQVAVAGDNMYGSEVDAGSRSRIFHVMPGGALYVRDVTLNNGEADEGGIVLNEGTLTMDRCVLSSGKADRGAGLVNTASAALTDVFFNGHSDRPPAGLGGCIHNRGTLTLNRVTLKRGQARLGCGGGIYNEASGLIDAVNLTVMRNRARKAVSGGICNDGGVIRCINCTIARNQGNHTAGGILNLGGTIELQNTILTLNWQAQYGRMANCAGDPVTSLGHNIDDGDTCNLNGPGDLAGVDPQVRGVHFLSGGWVPIGSFKTTLSPAVDAADASACPAVDAAGQPRPIGAGCDIGAYEQPF